MEYHKVGDKYRSKNGIVGAIEDINGVKRLVVRNFSGRVIQTINLKNIYLNKFEKVEL